MKWGTKLVFGFFIIAVFIFALFVPPFQKPDEPVHFYRAMALSQGQFSCTSLRGKSFFTLPASVYNFPKKLLTYDIAMRYGTKFPIGSLKQLYPYRENQETIEVVNYCFLPFPAYIGFAAGVIFASFFNNLLITFYTMRIISALLFILFSFLGYRMIPERYKTFFLLFICNPMVIHQATAVSYDAVLLAFICLIFPMWISLLEEKQVSFGKLVLFGSIVALSCVIKPGYFLLCGLFLPFFSKINWKRYGILISVFAAAILGILIYFAGRYIPLSWLIPFDMHDPQLFIIMRDPLYFISVIGRTIASLQEDFLAGTIGLFGWIDYKLPSYAVFLYMMITGAVIWQHVKKETKRIPGKVLALLGVLLLGLVFFICYYFYRTATPGGYKTIVGMQGRYMLPLLPFFLLFVSEGILLFKEKKILWMGIVGVGAIGITAIISSIYYRYYDYTKSFSNFDELTTAIAKKTVDVETLSPFSIDRAYTYTYAVNPGYKIGGFQMLTTNELSVSTPYRYTIQDKTCSKILRKGYLNELRDKKLSFLKGEEDIMITQYTPITSLSDDTICFTLEPLMPSETYLTILGDEKKPLVQFLYIAK